MLKRILGIVLAVAVVCVIGGLFLFRSNDNDTTVSANDQKTITIKGVIGSEKKDFFQDKEVRKILADNGLKVEIETAGSRQIATDTDLKAYDFAFPSSAPAAQKIQEKMKVSNTYSPFYSPMAVATYKPVIELLAQNGLASQDANGAWNIDMNAYLKAVSDGKRWNDLKGADKLYNSPRSMLISSTDIRKSNSAAMYLSIASYALNDNNVVSNPEQEQKVLANASKLFLSQGYSGASSEEPFKDYLTQGAGAVPMVMIYEAQFVGESLKKNSSITDQMVLAYPSPTVFSKHTLIPFNSNADKLGKLLSNNSKLTALEAQYGFRTQDNKDFVNVTTKNKIPVQESITNIADTPSYDVLESMISKISKQYDF